MKTLLVLVLLTAVCEAFLKDHHDLVMRRAKREIFTFRTLRILQCTQQCIEDFEKSQDSIKHAMNDFCPAYNKFKNCATACNAASSQTVQAIMSMFDPHDKICSSRYEELVRYLPCYAETDRCTSTCGDHEEFSSEIKAKFNRDQLTIGLTKAFNGLLKNSCSYLSCHLRCASPLIQEQCAGEKGQQADEFLSTFCDASMQSMYNGLKNSVAPGIENPKNCLNKNAAMLFFKK